MSVSRGRGDAGAGVLSTSFGIGIFLGFLLFAVQLLFNLYATSVVTSVTYDAARSVATGEAGRDEAIDRALDLLGGYRDNATFEWIDAGNPDFVRLRVHAENTRVLPEALVSAVGLDTIDRTIEVRVERPR